VSPSGRTARSLLLQVDKRGRFITNIAFANFVTAAVVSDDPRIKGSCVVILEEGDEGIFDRGTATKKLVHQLSSTGDPIFNLKVPASRIIGGYTVQDGVIVPNFSHGEVIEAVFRRTRVTVGLMTAAKLLSAVEPVIRYQRERIPRRGRREARLHALRAWHPAARGRAASADRRVATGEAAASLGFAAARIFDELEPLEKQKNALMKELGVSGKRAVLKALQESEQRAIELLGLAADDRDARRWPPIDGGFCAEGLRGRCPLPRHQAVEHRRGRQHDARGVSLMGGYGITEDCPGFLANKWMERATGGDLRGARGGCSGAS